MHHVPCLPNVCIEPGARLLFHVGENANRDLRMLDSYNARLRGYLTARRGVQTAAGLG
jgi:hypothetical protein